MRQEAIFVADFETSTDKWLDRDKGWARVWLWDVCDVINYKHKTGTSLNEFMRYVASKTLGESKKVYFHNLRYDGMYILSWLQLCDFKWVKDTKDLKKKTFTTLISGEGVFYSIKVCFGTHGHTKNTVTFVDSLKKFPQGVAALAKTYKLPMLKGEIDYNAYRPYGWKPTEEEVAYIHNDTEIVARALRTKLDHGLDCMTRAADALKEYIDIMGGKTNFRALFPVLNEQTDTNIRKAYKGGYVYLCEDYADKLLHNVTSYDVNSLFPSVMRYELLPFGVPVEFIGEYTCDAAYPLYIQFMVCNFKLKEGKLPTIQLKNSGRFCETEYLKDNGDEPVFLALTNVDLEIARDRYDIDVIEYVGGYKFMGAHGLFDAYIDKWIQVKIENNDNAGLRQNAKDMLNCLYGKFARRIKQESKMPVLEADYTPAFENYQDEDGEPIYTALACFVTAYARKKTMTTAQRFHDEGRYIYSDTDSVHVLGEQPEWLDVDNTRLGAWKNEGVAEDARFLRAKTYIKRKHGEIVVTCAGMPDNIKKVATFENFRFGYVYGDKLVQKAVKGGCVLVATNFAINVH